MPDFSIDHQHVTRKGQVENCPCAGVRLYRYNESGEWVINAYLNVVSCQNTFLITFAGWIFFTRFIFPLNAVSLPMSKKASIFLFDNNLYNSNS